MTTATRPEPDDTADTKDGASQKSSPPPPAGAPQSPAPRPSRARTILKWVALGTGLAAVLGAVAVVAVIAHYSSHLPSVASLKGNYRPPEVTRIRAGDGTLLANVFTERRTVIAFDEIPDHAKLAFLAAEDATFYEHEGLDYFGMFRALVANLRAGATRQGGSTITQQVVKNVLLDPERTYERKIKETILARRLEQELSKDEILALYLNHIYLGHGRYGIEEAARYYFGKKARLLNLPEAALLAGLVAAPERFSPRHHPERALERRAYVLRQMLAKGFITQALYDKVEDAPLWLAPAVEAESELSPEAVGEAKAMLRQVLGEDEGLGGYEVQTTIDPGLQAEARRAVRDNLDAYAKRHDLKPPYTAKSRRLWGKPFTGAPKQHRIYVGVVKATDDELGTIDVQVGDRVGRVFLRREVRYNPRGLPPSKFTEPGAVLRVAVLEEAEPGTEPPLRLELGPQSALVAIDVRSRSVVALVGSYEALAGGLDRATRARRQPGSAFKPFVYSYALYSRRFTPATVLSLPNVHRKEGDPPDRHIRVRQALAKSDNAAAVRLFRDVGPANVVQWAHAVGIESPLEPNESLALGAYEVTPLELADAYATFASGGVFAPARLVTKILGRGGSEVPLPERPPERRAMSPAEAYLITSLMQSVVREGTGRRARALGRPVAGKTGTTNDAKDAWFAGFSTDLVTVVWVGYDDALPLGPGESGSHTALPAWIDFMKAAHEGKPVTEFSRPEGIVTARIDPETGLLALPSEPDAVVEEFLDGTAPTELSPVDAGAEPGADAGAAPEDEGIRDDGESRLDRLEELEPPPPF